MVCVCVCSNASMHMAYTWRSEGNIRCQSPPLLSCLRQGLLFAAENTRLASPGAFRNSPASASHLTTEVLGLRRHALPSDFLMASKDLFIIYGSPVCLPIYLQAFICSMTCCHHLPFIYPFSIIGFSYLCMRDNGPQVW